MNNDLIKRGLAISYATSGLVRIMDGEKWIRVSEVKQSLNDVPTEPQEGEWIDYNNTFYKCPDCGYLLEKCCPQCQNKVILPKGGTE